MNGNKQLMQQIFAGLAEGDGALFLDSLADTFSWTIVGGKWANTWWGKEAVRRDLLEPLFAQFADRYTNTAQRFIAEDDCVVVECRGRVTTKAGVPYNNTYCWVCRLKDGKLVELTEYSDTELMSRVLELPAAAVV